MKRVLILGGTGEAAQLAAQAALLPGVEVITSLAGRTRHPVTPSGRVRTYPSMPPQPPTPVACRICSSCVRRGNLWRATAGLPSRALPPPSQCSRVSPSGCFSRPVDKISRRLHLSKTSGF